MKRREVETGVIPKLTTFDFESQTQRVKFVTTLEIKPGVSCDAYEFEGDNSKDLAIVTVAPNAATPLQRVLLGERTIEGYFSGKGSLTIAKPSGEKEVHEVGDSPEPFSVTIAVGELMQWQAAADSALVFSEVCYPPYQEGRFENLPDE